MKFAIPSTPLSLEESLAFADALGQRSDLPADPVMTDGQWGVAVTGAVSRGDRDGLGTLLQVELAPALAGGLVAMAALVRQAQAQVGESSDADELSFIERLQATQSSIVRAGRAVWAGEHREGLLPEHAGPAGARADSEAHIMAKVATYMHMELASDDVLQAIAGDLGLALRKLIGPARAAIECVDQGELDDLLSDPLQEELYETFFVVAAVVRYLLLKRATHEMIRRERSGG